MLPADTTVGAAQGAPVVGAAVPPEAAVPEFAAAAPMAAPVATAMPLPASQPSSTSTCVRWYCCVLDLMPVAVCSRFAWALERFAWPRAADCGRLAWAPDCRPCVESARDERLPP